ncbi:mechanosensitive ion channel family protein [Filimonas effusa]|nr:mechanosensitive ion channel family protein [Filimonas effusa]
MKIYLFLPIFLFFCFSAEAQRTDTSLQARNAKQDSLLMWQSQQLQQMEALRAADSIRRMSLEQQLNSLKATDNYKKDELVKELTELRKRDALQKETQRQKIDSLRRFVKGVPVIFFQDTLLTIYDRHGSFSPRERAVALLERLEKLSRDHFFHPDSLKIIPSGATADLAYNEMILLGISDNDALWMQMPATELAALYKERIATALLKYKEATSWKTILKETLLAALVIAVLLLIVSVTGRVLKRIKRRIIAEKGKRINGIRIRNYALFDVEREAAFLALAANVIRWIILLIVGYFALLVLFGIFPWTEHFADNLLRYFLTPLKHIVISIRDYLPNLVTIVVICIVFRLLLKGVRFLKTEIESGALHISGFYPDWANPTYQIIRVLVLAFMTIVIFPYLPGSDSAVFKGVSVFVGVIFTFGSAGALGNVVSGVVLTYMRSFKIGDRVQIGDITGDVIEKSLLVTRLRTIKNEIISIPNSTVMSSHTINYSSDAVGKGLIIHATVTIGYDVPWQQVHKLLIRAAEETPLIEKTPPPFVLQTGLDDFYIRYEINGYTKHPNNQAQIYSDLYKRVLDVFKEADIEVMSPQYYVVRNGNETDNSK